MSPDEADSMRMTIRELRAENARLRATEDTVFATYLGIMVLRTMCRKAKLTMAEQRSKEILDELGTAYPHFSARSALRDWGYVDKAKAALGEQGKG